MICPLLGGLTGFRYCEVAFAKVEYFFDLFGLLYIMNVKGNYS